MAMVFEAKKEWRMRNNDDNNAENTVRPDEPKECWCERYPFVIYLSMTRLASYSFSVRISLDFTSPAKSERSKWVSVDMYSYSGIELLTADEQYVISFTMMTGKKAPSTRQNINQLAETTQTIISVTMFCTLLECACTRWLWLPCNQISRTKFHSTKQMR